MQKGYILTLKRSIVDLKDLNLPDMTARYTLAFLVVTGSQTAKAASAVTFK